MAKVTHTYTHDVFGHLQSNSWEWRGEIALPSFSMFDLPYPVGTYPLLIYTNSRDEQRPAKELLELISGFTTKQEEFASKVLLAVWDDLMGVGPESRNWWYGKLPAKSMTYFNIAPPKSPDDLTPHMQFGGVECGAQVTPVPTSQPLIKLSFSCAWDQEHGLGVLLDGERVVGVGQNDVETFEHVVAPKQKLTINPFTGEPL